MKSIKVSKANLLKTLKANREQHRSVFLEAQEGYRKLIIAELETKLKEARNGKRIHRYVMASSPVDQTKEYDRVIQMLEMSEDDTVDLSEQDFACYVQDDWEWKRNFLHSNRAYSVTATRMLDALEDE